MHDTADTGTDAPNRGDRLRRFTPAYLAAAIAATIGFEAGLLLEAARGGYLEDATRDLLPALLVFGAYSLGYTLVLGLMGWLLLRLLHLRGYVAYATCGAAFGALAAELGEVDPFTWHTPLLLSYSLAGLCAGIVFYWVYYDLSRAHAKQSAA